jgi:nucleotide-binding universal stress UspA family protein
MSICVAVTDSREGQAALAAAVEEAAQLTAELVVVNLTGADLDPASLGARVSCEIIVPSGTGNLDEVERVLRVLEDRPDISRLVVGVRKRSPVGKAVLGSIPQRLILEATVPVLAVKTPVP